MQRVILIDSYTPGRITELPIAGGTAIVGANGRGKTSLLQLIPAFFGERPDRIVKPVSNQGNFARYYLPRSNSFIVFEYQRDDALCCAVLCADASGDGVEYRFVRSGYDQDWFVHDDKTALVASTNLAERLKQSGVECSRRMPLDQYRAIIQGKRIHGSDLKQHRRDIIDYAFCPSSHSLPHIERIVFGMFMRRSNFADLQRMIVSTVTDTSKSIALGAERKKIEAWPDACDSYMAVMAEESRMTEAQAAYANVMAAEHELRTIHGRFHAFDLALGTDENEQSTRLANATTELEEAENRHKEARRDVLEKIQSVGNTIEHFTSKLRALAEQNESYQSQGVPTLAGQLDREQEIIQTLDQLKARRTALLAQLSSIEDEYGKIRDALSLSHKERQLDFELQKSRAKDDFQAQREAIQTEGKRGEDEARQTYSAEEAPLQQAMDAANEALGWARGLLDNPQPDAEIVVIAEQQEAKVDASRSRHEQAAKDEEAARGDYQKANNTFAKLEQALRGTKDEIHKVEVRLEALLRQASPDENSLLYFLRRERANWPVDIAKVLREDLLSRTDLGPVNGAVQDSVYGLQLNLDVLETPLAADESALQREVDAVRGVLQGLNERVADQEGTLAKSGRNRATAEGLATQSARQAAIEKAALVSEEQLLRKVRSDVQRSRDVAKEKAKGVHAQAMRAVEAAKHVVLDRRGRLEKEIVAIRDRQAMRESERQVQLERLLSEIASKEEEATRQHNNTCEQIAQERLTKLKDNGVDTTALILLEGQIGEAAGALKKIDASRNLIVDWRRWLNSDWLQKAAHEDALAKAGREKEGYEAIREAATKAWFEDSSRRKEAIARITKKLGEVRDTRTKVAQHRKALEDYPANVNAQPDYNPAWQVASLVEQSTTQFRALSVNEESLKQQISALKRVFTATRHSPADQYYETQRQIIGPDRADKPREWIPAFKAWFMSEHLQCLNLLRVDARTIADAVADFHDRMDSFHLKVRQFNRELQQNIDSNQGFKSIGGLTVEIVSSLHELEYWDTVVKVAKSRVDWIRDDALELPPPEFSVALRELLSHWQLKEGIQAELTGLVRIQGEVIENGNRRPFKKAEDLEHISSNGLSYIVMVLLFLAFINRVRGAAPVNIVWALDEIGSLDTGNTVVLVDILKRNNLTLVTACPDPKPDVLAGFRNRRSISKDRRIYDPTAAIDVGQAEAQNETGVPHV